MVETRTPQTSKQIPKHPPLNHTPHHKSELRFTTTPNLLTMIRILLVPLVVGLLYAQEETTDWIAAGIFIVASITDYFDGYIARRQHSVTVYGKLMDPLADKFLVVSSLIILQSIDRIHPFVVILLICRELAITGLRALASAERVIIPASVSAKWKTALQMIAIPMLMVPTSLLGISTYHAGLLFLYFSLLISLWSLKDYLVEFFRGLQQKRRCRKSPKKKI